MTGPSRNELKRLADILARISNKDSPLTVNEIRGFLFAVLCCPELVRPSEWFGCLFGDDATFNGEHEVAAVMDTVMKLHNQIAADIMSGRCRIPGERFRPKVMLNFESDAPAAQWSLGFIRGHSFLEESWDHKWLNEEEKAAVTMATSFLSFFGSRSFAGDLHGRIEGGEHTIEDLATLVCSRFCESMRTFARLNRRELR